MENMKHIEQMEMKLHTMKEALAEVAYHSGDSSFDPYSIHFFLLEMGLDGRHFDALYWSLRQLIKEKTVEELKSLELETIQKKINQMLKEKFDLEDYFSPLSIWSLLYGFSHDYLPELWIIVNANALGVRVNDF
ncbi:MULTISPECIES: hypothetical protein [unclassified Lactococcus]|uniref:hypothetical protein n=1 Tax=unclassified Lactococcus TaxID=2643510 RepID=UPI0011C78125|nr:MULTISPECIES: hypothetical protein [unclassified Lactococcus]MQW22701.1 hypothetical protein [Lactococcus sp. dk101]TXK44708.1 hypothetical protein FVP42_03660 [Lactococcus sp. dk310]TXK50602.1 hypothetical protein FVP43_03660 [Lactococcus sp. dk322]